MEGGGAPTLPSHPADRASLALAAAVGGDTSGCTRSLAISQRGHGHHLLQQNLKEVRQLRARAQDLAEEASCIMHGWQLDRCETIGIPLDYSCS